jgi:dUTP pyrophosphatase
MIRNGTFVAQHLTPQTTSDAEPTNDQIQPNGVDLRIGELYRVSGNHAYFGEEEYVKPKRTKIQPEEEYAGRRQFYSIPPGHYIVVYDEKIHIPEGHVGHVYPRSRLMRSGIQLTTALWDQGYEGVGEGMLIVPKSIKNTEIQVSTPIAQMTLREAESPEEFETYDGSHQGERLESENR